MTKECLNTGAWKSLLINAHLHDSIGDDPGYGEGLLFQVNFTNTDLEK